MKKSGRVSVFMAICSVIALVMLSGCGKKDDTVSVAKQADKVAGISVPGSPRARKLNEP